MAHADAFDESILIRLRAFCDVHLKLVVEKSGTRLQRTLEVCKVHKAELDTDNIISFKVQPGMGIRVSAVSKMKA